MFEIKESLDELVECFLDKGELGGVADKLDIVQDRALWIESEAMGDSAPVY